MKVKHLIILGSLLFSCFVANLHAAYVLQNGRLVNATEVPTLPVKEHYALGVKALSEGDWRAAARQFKIISLNFPKTSYGQDSNYYLGIADYNLFEFDAANTAFSQYLKEHNNPKFFQSAIEYKYSIAEKFKEGAKRRFLGTRRLPKWASGTSLALTIYDEVIAAMPCHDLAARALYSKGNLLWEMNQFKDSVESFQLLIRRFSKHELAPQCYVTISKVYLDQCQRELQNPDILAFAQINSRKFKRDFPKDERLEDVDNDVLSIKEVYAKALYDTGKFYERKGKPSASLIYYQNSIDQFPETKVAKRSTSRLNYLNALTGAKIPAKEVATIEKEEETAADELSTPDEENLDINFED